MDAACDGADSSVIERLRSRHRFFVEPGAVQGGQVRFPAIAARQMRRVLRLRRGDRVTAFDGTGVEYSVALVSLRDEVALGSIEARVTPPSEPRLEIVLCQALLPREKFELVLQKATEVGVRIFIPLVTQRSLVPARALDGRRLERWRRIILEAAEQARRASVPSLEEPLSLADALARFRGHPSLLAWEQEETVSLRQAFGLLSGRPGADRLTLFVGPEGGFARAEVAAARASGAMTVSLGPRTLRADTAGPLLAALALYHAGDLELTR
jgi:16S rRNA (uracil1498-N3)-methyltransferase